MRGSASELGKRLTTAATLLACVLTIVAVPGIVRAAAAGAADGPGLVAAACRDAHAKPASVAPVVRRVCREVPTLARRGSSVSDLRAVDLIREWAFRHVDSRERGDVVNAAGSRRTLDPAADAWRMSAREYLRIFDHDEWGALCGDAAWFLLRVYNAFGFDAFTYDYGLLGTLATHVITLVRVNGHLLPQDAYLDQTIRGPGGERLDFTTVLMRLAHRDESAIQFVAERPLPSRDSLIPDAVYQLLQPIFGTPGTIAQGLHDCERRDGYWRCRDSWRGYESVVLHQSDFGKVAMDALAAAGWPRSIDYLMMYPLGVSSDADGWTTTDRIEEHTPTAHVLRSIYRAAGLDTNGHRLPAV